MTFSIVAADVDGGDWGVAVASKFPAVGSVVPWAQAGIGAVATQSWANTSFGPRGLELMGSGISAEETIRRLTGEDDGREKRQVGMVDVTGSPATFTGSDCMEWAGGRTGAGYACQGNILIGPEVVEALARGFEEAEGDLVDRLLAAVVAGDRAGGDRRGRQSAALLVVREGGGYEGFTDRYVDVRVDDHPQAVDELVRVFEVYDRELLVRKDQILDLGPQLVRDVQKRLAALGHYKGEVTGGYDEGTRLALAAFAGEFNLEGRLRDDDRVSETLVRELRDITPEV
ncbi:MAG TPA: DUF1028 domain-containing protein [Actinomycetota bacterium]|jgi:uncharacterized Ntn-hydrolase superfamily protein|nr:DUF1028 domain-containing protein [Actinomycetota bacterium]